jgi:amino acid permease
LSEEAKNAYIKKRLGLIRSCKGSGTLLFGVGLIMVILSISMSSFPSAFSIDTLVVGVLLCIFGVLMRGYFSFEEAKLINRLGTMSISVPKCPKCGKELPKGNFASCPFCGASFERGHALHPTDGL